MTEKDPKPSTSRKPQPESETPPTGAAVPDPDDQSPRGRFNRGEISWDELVAQENQDT